MDVKSVHCTLDFLPKRLASSKYWRNDKLKLVLDNGRTMLLSITIGVLTSIFIKYQVVALHLDFAHFEHITRALVTAQPKLDYIKIVIYTANMNSHEENKTFILAEKLLIYGKEKLIQYPANLSLTNQQIYFNKKQQEGDNYNIDLSLLSLCHPKLLLWPGRNLEASYNCFHPISIRFLSLVDNISHLLLFITDIKMVLAIRALKLSDKIQDVCLSFPASTFELEIYLLREFMNRTRNVTIRVQTLAGNAYTWLRDPNCKYFKSYCANYQVKLDSLLRTLPGLNIYDGTTEEAQIESVKKLFEISF